MVFMIKKIKNKTCTGAPEIHKWFNQQGPARNFFGPTPHGPPRRVRTGWAQKSSKNKQSAVYCHKYNIFKKHKLVQTGAASLWPKKYKSSFINMNPNRNKL